MAAYIPAMFDDSSLRVHIYDEIVRTCEVPSVADLAREFRTAEQDVRAALWRMRWRTGRRRHRSFRASRAAMVGRYRLQLKDYAPLPVGRACGPLVPRHAWKLPRGAILSPLTCWELAREWYRDRRDPKWRRHTVDEAHALFRQLGLTGDFWRLS
jgi:hypothetical protein